MIQLSKLLVQLGDYSTYLYLEFLNISHFEVLGHGHHSM